MTGLPTGWLAACALVFMLGLRHGVDADHLAAIDGMTRLSGRRGARFSRWCGVLFSVGHGIVVLLMAVGAGLMSQEMQLPGWLDTLGAWASIGFLLLLGSLNLRALVAANGSPATAPIGLRAARMGKLFDRVRSPAAVAAVGAAFAVSFDTLSQALGARFGGVEQTVLLGCLFLAGMLVADGMNGFWIARMFAGADGAAARASRAMCWAVVVISLSVATLGVARMSSPGIDHWWEGRGLWLSAAVVAVMVSSYLWVLVGGAVGQRRHV
jgi:nickel/cobalt transporter (NiCoT) family protein